MIRHISLLTFTPGTDDEWVQELRSTLGAMASSLDGLIGFSCDPDAGINEGTADVAIIAEFDTEAAYLAYRDLPEHRRILTEVIGPRLAQRTACQTRSA